MSLHDMEEQLSKCILQEQLLKSENGMMKKELNRLKKRWDMNNQYSESDKKIEVNDKKNCIVIKHRKNMGILESKIENCEETISKLRALLHLPQPSDQTQKQNFSNNNQYPLEVKTKKQKQQTIYESIKCEDCQTIMQPYQYFKHLLNQRCPYHKI